MPSTRLIRPSKRRISLSEPTRRSKRKRVETVAGIEAKELLSGQRSK